MASKRRSTSKGRGADILLGEPQAVEIESPDPESTPVEAGSQATDESGSEPASASLGETEAPVPGPAATDESGSEPASASLGETEAPVPGPAATDESGSEPAPGSLGEAEAPVPSPAATESASELDEELAAALYEEARDGEAAQDEEAPSWLLDAEWPPTPEMEMALLEQGLEDEEQAEVEAETPSTVMEETMEDNKLGDTAVRSETSIPQTGSVLPPRSSQVFYGGGEVEYYAALDIQDAGEQVEPIELPDRPWTETQKQETRETSKARIQELDQEIDQVYELVQAEVGENKNITTECFNYLLKARDIVMRGDVTLMAQAEYEIEMARARLGRAAASARSARRNAWWILTWGFLWGMVFVALLVMLDSTYAEDIIGFLNLRSRYIDPEVLLPAMVWGGVGGVVAVWYSLFKHVSVRDFDSSFNITYVGKPFFGLVLGATVYMVIHLMIVSLGIWPAGLPEQIGEAEGSVIAPWIIYLLAWASGFKENRIFGVVDQAMKRLFSTSS